MMKKNKKMKQDTIRILGNMCDDTILNEVIDGNDNELLMLHSSEIKTYNSTKFDKLRNSFETHQSCFLLELL